MFPHDPFDKRQTESRAIRARREIRLKDPLLLVLRNPFAGVQNLDPHPVRQPGEPHQDFPFTLHGVQGVAK